MSLFHFSGPTKKAQDACLHLPFVSLLTSQDWSSQMFRLGSPRCQPLFKHYLKPAFHFMLDPGLLTHMLRATNTQRRHLLFQERLEFQPLSSEVSLILSSGLPIIQTLRIHQLEQLRSKSQVIRDVGNDVKNYSIGGGIVNLYNLFGSQFGIFSNHTGLIFLLNNVSLEYRTKSMRLKHKEYIVLLFILHQL